MSYPLTDKAIDLLPMIMEAIYWGDKHSPVSGMTPVVCRSIDKRGITINEFREKTIGWINHTCLTPVGQF
jgi:hypothetical protein